ncbi:MULTISPECIES: cytochrome b/b6 domain-containing protein [unclassified Bradyrhizobium]|uniref:cytochrome b/b6 domain-containing protein n=1 Tax=unclassified Bradyrhizobium TaxID=2631580 RepID=UPI0032E49F28
MSEQHDGPRPAHQPAVTGATPAPPMVEVWDLPVRLCHWALVMLIAIAWWTPNTQDTLHRVAGYGVLIVIAFRTLWGFLGNPHARFGQRARLLRALPGYLVALARGRHPRTPGLNPAGAAMTTLLLALLVVSAASGWMQVTLRFFGVAWVQDTHTYVSHAILILVGIHALGAVVASLAQGENLVWAMITGRKRSAADRPEAGGGAG